MKLATSDEWTFATKTITGDITEGYLAVRPSSIYGTFGSTTIYVPKAVMPERDTNKMETITDTGLTCPASNSVNVAEKAGAISDFVFKTDFTVNTAAATGSSGSTNGLYFGLHPDMTEGADSSFQSKWNANAPIVYFGRDAIKITRTGEEEVKVDIPSDIKMTTAGAKYNLYISIDAQTKTVVAGMKLATSDEWTFVTKTITGDITAGYLAVRPSSIYGAFANTKIYSSTEYSFDDKDIYTINGNKINAKLNVTRNLDSARDTAVFVTAVYRVSGGVYTLDNISATEEKRLTLDNVVSFSNEVSIPTLATGEKYEVRSFLWYSFDDNTPLTEAFDMVQ